MEGNLKVFFSQTVRPKADLLAYLCMKYSGKLLVTIYCPLSILSACTSVDEQLFLKASFPELALRFQPNFTDMFLGECASKKVQRIEIHDEHWLPWNLMKTL